MKLVFSNNSTYIEPTICTDVIVSLKSIAWYYIREQTAWTTVHDYEYDELWFFT